MKAGGATLERAAWSAAAIAFAWFAFAAAWGCDQIPGGGHVDGGSAATTLYASPIVRWHILYPSSDIFATSTPPPSTYYCHHPFGVHYVAALTLAIFGRHDFVVHIAPILMSIATVPLLFFIGKKNWGLAAGAASACGFVVVPIAVGFASYQNLEVITIFGLVLFFWGLSYERMGASLAGALIVCSGDWIGYVFLAPVLGWAFVRAFVLSASWTPRVPFKWYATWWAWSVLIAVGTVVLWLGLFLKADKIGDWLGSGEMRGGGQGVPLQAALAGRSDWIDFSFTPLAITLGKIMAPLCLIRAVLIRSDCELYAPTLLLGSVVQYVVFKRGADVHIFWPHYFAAYFALALAPATATIELAARRIARAFPRRGAFEWAGWTALAIGLAPALAMAPDAVRSLAVWRRTGGKYDDHGSPVRSEIDMLYVVKNVILPRTPLGATIDKHASIPMSWEHHWSAQRNSRPSQQPEVGAADAPTHPEWLARPSELTTDEETRIAATAHVQAFGDAWVINQGEHYAPIDAWRVHEREPNVFEWLLYGGWEPVRSLDAAPDPLLTWEWRVHFGQPVDPPEYRKTTLLDDLRIEHNIAIFRGDMASANAIRKQIVAELDHTVTAEFDQGIRLVGVQVTHGVHASIEIWFEASGPTAGRAVFNVRSAVEAPAAFSLIPASKTERDMAVLPPVISTKLWHKGFLYRVEAVLNHRIGRERYWGSWSSLDGAPAPNRTDAARPVVLATVR
jgi:hypothetical protein